MDRNIDKGLIKEPRTSNYELITQHHGSELAGVEYIYSSNDFENILFRKMAFLKKGDSITICKT